MTTKVKNTEPYKDAQADTIVCKGKLICGNVGSFSKLMDIEELRGKLRPIIISQNETIEFGDKYYGIDNNIHTFENGCYYSDEARKILAIPENFSPKHLQAIVDGKLKDGAEVFLECERVVCKSASGGVYPKNEFKIKLNKDNHIKLFPVNPVEKETTDILTFDYWMLTEIDLALQLKYDKLMKESGDGKYLQAVGKKHGMEIMKQEQKKFESNRYHPLGRVALIQKRIQEIKDQYK